MRFKMEKSETWKNCIGAISNLIPEASFTFSPDRIEMKAMDPSHVALVEFELFPSSFEEYSVEDSVSVGVDLVELNKIMSRAGKNDEFIMEIPEEEDRINIEFIGDSKRRFSTPIIEIGKEETPNPVLEFSARAKIESSLLKDGLKDAALVSDNVKIEFTSDSFEMSAESDTGSARARIPEEADNLKELEVEEHLQSMYSIGYMEDILKASSSGELVKVNMGKDIPIKLDFPVTESGGKLIFVLAPRVERE